MNVFSIISSIFLVNVGFSFTVNVCRNNGTLEKLVTSYEKDICYDEYFDSDYLDSSKTEVLPSNCQQDESGLKCHLTNTSFDENIKLNKNITCSIRMTADENTPTVLIINGSELLHRLSMWNETSNYCALVMFYAHWCVFCARLAPAFNALSRAYPQIEFMAMNVIGHRGYAARYGSIAVPNVLLFHNSKPIARFNTTVKDFDTLKDFIYNFTNLMANSSIIIEENDYIGPLSSVATEEMDYLLILSWCFVILLSIVMFSRSLTGYKIFSFIASFGQENPHHHVD